MSFLTFQNMILFLGLSSYIFNTLTLNANFYMLHYRLQRIETLIEIFTEDYNNHQDAPPAYETNADRIARNIMRMINVRV